MQNWMKRKDKGRTVEEGKRNEERWGKQEEKGAWKGKKRRGEEGGAEGWREEGREGAEVHLSPLVTATRISNLTPLVTDPCSH